MAIRVVKIVPNNFVNQSRDTREIVTLLEMGYDVTIIIKEEGRGEYNGPLRDLMMPLPSRPLIKHTGNVLVNRIYSFYLWVRTVRRQKADVLSCHDIICLYIGWISTLFLKNKPKLVYDSHEFEYENGSRRPFWKWCMKYLERFVIKKCSMVMMVNDTIAEQVQKLHNLKDRPRVVRNIPDYWELDNQVIAENRARFRNKYGIMDEETIVLYQGGIIEGRGVEKAIQMVSITDGVRLVIMGYGEPIYIENTRKLVVDEHVEERVIFLPAVPQSELWKYTSIADIGLCTIEKSWLSYYYSLPNKLFEYIQALVPILGSDFPEIGRIVNDYHVGICCDPGDPVAISRGIKELLLMSNTGELKEGLVKAKNELCWEKEKERLVSAYTELMNK